MGQIAQGSQHVSRNANAGSHHRRAHENRLRGRTPRPVVDQPAQSKREHHAGHSHQQCRAAYLQQFVGLVVHEAQRGGADQHAGQHATYDAGNAYPFGRFGEQQRRGENEKQNQRKGGFAGSPGQRYERKGVRHIRTSVQRRAARKPLSKGGCFHLLDFQVYPDPQGAND